MTDNSQVAGPEVSGPAAGPHPAAAPGGAKSDQANPVAEPAANSATAAKTTGTATVKPATVTGTATVKPANATADTTATADTGAPAASATATEPEVVVGEVLAPAAAPAEPDADAADSATPAESGAAGGAVGSTQRQLDERTADLLRVMAEYANYRKRVDRDRAVATEQATGAVLLVLLPILDDLDRAREHGDLVGPFGSVAEQLHSALAKFGLVAFGAKGDVFDPSRHEAVAHQTSEDVSEPTCVDVLRPGYQLGERLLRPAMVVVADAA